MVRIVKLVGVIPRFSFFLVFACFLGIAKNYPYLHIINNLALSLFLTY